MLGFADLWITLAFVLCIASAALCVAHGYLNWNNGGEEEAPLPEDEQWLREEEEFEEEL